MNSNWNAYKEALLAKMPFLAETLREGVSESDISSAEAETGITFPQQLKELYLANDGDTHKALCGMILGFHFLSLESLLYEWRSMKKLAEDADLNDSSRFSSTPEGCIKRRYADMKWLPVCSDDGGNFIGIDLDPDINSTVGQVINFGRDEHNKTVLAKDLNAFFDRLTRIVNSDDFFIGDYDGEDVVLLGTDDIEEGAYLTDYLTSEDSVQ